ncbi:DUF2283 domain-containing protein [Candidatus Gottesmanbacteria bacterium]|nr:DUF2283 domain-containing protein [Candidatus Gottesmanbacteria bacterium]MBI5452410.1 DUF2283 domain-containing protein [Candidatus Gottesmanbacteria bacterium]
MSLKYYQDDDILVIRLSRKPYDYAEKEGDFIVHFSKDNKLVRIEVLNAKRFLEETHSILPHELKKKFASV